jgi:hypothetical protein
METPKTFSLKELVAGLTEELGKQKDSGVRDVEGASKLMTAFDASLGEWQRFVFLDPCKYTRNLIADDRAYTLMLLCWDKGQKR